MQRDMEAYIKAVRDILGIAEPFGHVPRSIEWRVDGLREFLVAAGGVEYPSDVLRLLEAARLVGDELLGGFPPAEEVKILEECWNEAWGWSGNLRWQYSDSVLTLKYSPKKTGAYYEVTFTPDGRGGPLFLPLTVRFRAWADMDEEAGHHDECPMFHPTLVERESHDDDCPWRTVFPDATDEALDAAAEACECSFDCNCEPDVVVDKTRVFRNYGDGFKHSLVKWLSALLHSEALEEEEER